MKNTGKRLTAMTQAEKDELMRVIYLQIEDMLPPGPHTNGRSPLLLLVVDDNEGVQCGGNFDPRGFAGLLRDTADAIEGKIGS